MASLCNSRVPRRIIRLSSLSVGRGEGRHVSALKPGLVVHTFSTSKTRTAEVTGKGEGIHYEVTFLLPDCSPNKFIFHWRQLNRLDIILLWHVISFSRLSFLHRWWYCCEFVCTLPLLSLLKEPITSCIFQLSSRCAITRTGWHLHLTSNPQPSAGCICLGFIHFQRT